MNLPALHLRYTHRRRLLIQFPDRHDDLMLVTCRTTKPEQKFEKGLPWFKRAVYDEHGTRESEFLQDYAFTIPHLSFLKGITSI